DVLYGDAGADYLEGGQGNDTGFGGTGSDLLVGGYGSDVLDGEQDSDSYVISSRGGPTTQLTTAYDSGAGDMDLMTVQGPAADDTFLLRAMADYYFPKLTKVQAVVEKVFKSDKPDKLALIQRAITNAYTVHDVPAGMLDAVAAAFGSHPVD